MSLEVKTTTPQLPEFNCISVVENEYRVVFSISGKSLDIVVQGSSSDLIKLSAASELQATIGLILNPAQIEELAKKIAEDIHVTSKSQ